MAENPATWGRAEQAVEAALQAFDEDLERPPGEKLTGLSLNRQITDALRAAGLLQDSPSFQQDSPDAAAAYAALEMITAGRWDRYLRRLGGAIRLRTSTEEYEARIVAGDPQ